MKNYFNRSTQSLFLFALGLICLTAFTPSLHLKPKLPVLNTIYEWLPIGSGINFPNPIAVHDMAWDSNGDLYAVGDFNIVNQSYRDGFAKWNGNSWVMISPNNLLGGVRAIAIDQQDNIYLGGQMLSAAGAPINHLIKWDGTDFIELPGTDGWIYDLEFDNYGNLYAAGSFSNAGGIRVNNIAMFDGCRWHSLKEGLNDQAYSITFDSLNNLYVGGRFTKAGETDAEKIAKWDGNNWAPIGTLGVNGDSVYKVYYSDTYNMLYIGGYFTYVDGVNAKNIAAFNGQNWTNLGNGFNREVYALEMDQQGNLYAGGNFQSSANIPFSRIAKWDGIAWQEMSSGADDAVRQCAFSPIGELYIGGQFITASGDTVNGIAKWAPSTQGSALNFAGDNDFVSIPDHDDLEFDTDEDFTIEVSIRVPTTPQTNLQSAGNVIIEKWNGNAIGYPYAIRYLNQTNQYPGKIRAGRGDGNTYPSIVSSTSVNDGQWHHVAFVKDSSQLLLYIDGVLEATGTDNTSNPTVNGLKVNIGRRNNNTVHFTGDIDELRIWKKPLCVTEINASMTCEIDPLQVDSLNAYFKFNDEQIGGPGTTTLQNEINSSLNGTLDSFGFVGLTSNWIDDSSVIDGTQCSLANDPCGSQGSNRVTNDHGFPPEANQNTQTVTLPSEGVLIYPNPTNENLLLQWENHIKVSSISILDNKGQEIWQTKVQSGTASLQILKSEARLLPGLHYIKIQTEGKPLIYKIVIQ